MEYGRELDRCLKAEEERRQVEAKKIKQQREKLKQETDEVYNREQSHRENLYRVSV